MQASFSFKNPLPKSRVHHKNSDKQLAHYSFDGPLILSPLNDQSYQKNTLLPKLEKLTRYNNSQILPNDLEIKIPELERNNQSLNSPTNAFLDDLNHTQSSQKGHRKNLSLNYLQQ